LRVHQSHPEWRQASTTVLCLRARPAGQEKRLFGTVESGDTGNRNPLVPDGLNRETGLP
jgi:hypothetical protein